MAILRRGETTPRRQRAAFPATTMVAVVMLVLPPAATATEPDRGLPDRIDAHVESRLPELRVPGAAVAVVGRDGTIRAEGYGRAAPDGRPVTADTPFQIASLSKWITAIAVQQLIDAGRLAMDDRIGEHVPWFRAPGSDAAQVTVRDLLAHTSGWSTRDGLAGWTDGGSDPAALERNARRLAATPRNHPRGWFEYSNANYDLLGYLVEVVSGRPYGEYLAERIFEPLGMRHSHADHEAARADGLAAGFYQFFGLPIAHDISFVAGSVPSSFLMSSAADLGRLASAMLQRGSLGDAQALSPSGVTAMRRPLVRLREGTRAYAMGLWVKPMLDAGALAEPRAGVFTYEVPVSLQHGGDHATAAADIILLPREGVAVIVLLNANDPTAPAPYHGLADEVAAIVLGRPVPVASAPWLSVHPKLALAGLAMVVALVVTIAVRAARLRHRHRRKYVVAQASAVLAATAALTALIATLLGEASQVPLALAPSQAPDLVLVVAVVAVLVGVAAVSSLRHLSRSATADWSESNR